MVQTWIYNCDWKNIASFIDNEPLYVTMRDGKGRLPIHNAFIKKAPEFIIEKLISHDRESLTAIDFDDLYPIHYAIISGYTSNFLIKILTAYPDIVRLNDKDGKNIFHYCLMFGAKLDVIVYLADLPPVDLAYTGISSLNLTGGALKQGFVESRVRSGKLGIHFAIENRASYEILEFLVTRYPTSCAEYFDGNSPLHLACQKRCPYNIIQLLLRTFPDAASQRANMGMMPLHIAAANKADPDTINLLLLAYPDACLERDRTLRNPLHWALENTLCDESILSILFAQPEAVKAERKRRENRFACGYRPRLQV
jgi:ankyrin repeat protein